MPSSFQDMSSESEAESFTTEEDKQNLKTFEFSSGFDAPVFAILDPTQFHSKYQRNNKRGGLKNLRCFPTCGEMHKTRGFCGRSVEVLLSPNLIQLRQIPGHGWYRNYHCFAEFVRIDQTRFKVGEHIAISLINSLERTVDEPVRPLIRGEMVDQPDCRDKNSLLSPYTIKYEFNRKRKGWHYGWTANKHSCNTEHCLQIYVMSLKDGKYLVENIVRSPSFVLFCRRRRRFKMEPCAPVAPPRKRIHEDSNAIGANGTFAKFPSSATSDSVVENKKLKFEIDDERSDMANCLVSFAASCEQILLAQKLNVAEVMTVK